MKLELFTLLGCICISSVISMPQVTDSSSLVLSSTTTTTVPPIPEKSEAPKEDVPVIPKIYEMHVESNVSNRFAKTLVTSKVKNLDKAAREVTFSVVIPEPAYISGFTMEIDGKSYEAYVQEKEEAQKTYKDAVSSGQAAAHVAVNARDSNRFTVSVNVEPQSKAVFYLRYEELLARQNNQYELVLNIHPGQPVKTLDVEVRIDESRPLKFVKAPPLRSGNEIAKNDEKLDPSAIINIVNKTSAVVKFSPDIEKQKELANKLGTAEENGLSGQFVVQYDVERDPSGGEVLLDNGYFVHFFAPNELKALPKQVVFVLDTSGSMQGIRITQLKEAMSSILSELKPEDVFNIVEFGSIVKVWNVEQVAVQYESGVDRWSYIPEPQQETPFPNKTDQPLPPAYPATEENVKKAGEVVKKLEAFGGTDIQSALKVGLQLVQNNLKEDKKHQPIIVFLTDGEATVGETFNDKIISTITELNSQTAPIFSLSFGDGADRKFLQTISLKNLGFARHIYEAADASLQLQEFYKQISSPLLTNVTFEYVSNVTEVTKTVFPILFDGSEIVVAGQIIDPGFAPPLVHGWGINGPVKLTPVVETPVGGLERLWAYLTLQQILEQRDAADNKTGPTQEALRIALKYNFVSDVSSLVVVKPNATSAVETEDASNNDGRYPIIAGGGQPLIVGGGGGGYQGFGSAAFSSGGYGSVALAAPPQSFRPASISNNSSFLVSLPSTPISPAAYLTTTAPIKEKDDKIIDDVLHPIDDIQRQLPWLTAILKDDETISVLNGTFKLGLNETLVDHPDCPNDPNNSIGSCTLIFRCSKIYPLLTDVTVYQKHFCDLNGYAGVCCPKEEEKQKTN